jgi:hypothetical protein
MKKHLLTLTLFATALAAQGQSLTPAAVTSAATKMTQSNGSLSFTVGELVVLTQTDANGNTLGGGFTNGAAGSTSVLPVSVPDAAQLMVNVYPNPTADMVTVHVQHSTVAAYTLHLTDLTGKLVYTARHAGVSGRINLPMQSYPAGTYLLTLSAEDATPLGSYRIVRQ